VTDDAKTTAGILLLALVAVEYGGTFLLRVVRGAVPMTPFQVSFARAGHAHAGVLVILGVLCQVLVDQTGASGIQRTLASGGVPLAAILMPAGFFLSSIGQHAERPNRFIGLVYAGAVSLAAGAIALGLALLA
jgi:ABC-type thiamin/hydroxymethylpyrimidine transport system permease subunit